MRGSQRSERICDHHRVQELVKVSRSSQRVEPVTRDLGGPGGTSSIGVNDETMRRGEQPRSHRTVRRQVARVPPGPQHGFLDDILCELLVTARAPPHEPKQCGSVFVVQSQFLVCLPWATHA